MLERFIKLITSQPILLGRWCRTSKKLNDLKVDLANIDHCGTCVVKHKELKPKPTDSKP